MTRLVKMVALSAVAAGALMLVGCGGKSIGKYNLELVLDKALEAQPPSITVNVIAPPKAEEGRWRSMDMTEYWNPNNQMRADNKDRIKEFQFGPGDTGMKKLSESDPIWEKWAGSEFIFVLARLPNASGSGEQDHRRLILERDRAYWKDVSTIKIGVKRSELSLETAKTPPPPPK